MKKSASIVIWTLVAVVAIFGQLYVFKLLTDSSVNPDLVETALFTPEQYPEVAARITPEALQEHIDRLSAIPSRLTGTAGADQAADYILGQFRALGVGEPVVQEFPIVVPVHNRAELIINGTVYPIRPMQPNGVLPPALPEGGITTPLVYCGFGRLEDLTGKQIEDATVVIESGSREGWLHLFDLGAKAVVIVERERPRSDAQFEYQNKTHQNLPRFWMTRDEGAPLIELLKSGDQLATVHSDARWEARTGKNLWIDIPGASTLPINEDEVVVFSAYYDSVSFVPDLAPGDEQACGIAALLELAKIIRDHPFQKNVRLLATSGHYQALEGMRRYVWENVGKHPSSMTDVSPGDHAALFALDLSSGTRRVGLFYGGGFFSQKANNLKPRVSDLGRRATEYAKGIAEAFGVKPQEIFVDTINPDAGRDWLTYLPLWPAVEHEAALLAGIPSLAFITTNDTRMHAVTPTHAGVNIEHLTEQVRMLACMLPTAFNVEGRYLRRSLPRGMFSISGRAVSFDPRAGYLPNKPVPGAVVLTRRMGDLIYYAGTYGFPMTISDENGEFEIIGMGTQAVVPPHLSQTAIEVYKVERDKITWAPDFGQMGKTSYPTTLVASQKAEKVLCVLFEAESLSIYNLHDSRNYNALTNLMVLEAGSNSEPPVYGTTLPEAAWWSFFSTAATIFAPADTNLKIAAGATAIEKRMLFLNVPEEIPEGERFNIGEGFNISEVDAIRRAYYQAATDMWRINESRIAFFGSHGIEHNRVNRLHGMAREMLDRAAEHLERKDYAAFYSETRQALSLETRAYPDVMGMSTDTVRGLVFYLALLLPFALIMERMFLSGRRIETRVLGIVGFFLGMFFILRFTHPGFLIVLSPMVVLLGFVVAALSTVVIGIVMGKLEALVTRQKTEEQGEHESGVQVVSGFAVALDMGIANMRRRKARTILTSITLIVLTFSVLSFVSITEDVRTQRLSYAEGDTPYEGILLRTMRWDPFPYGVYSAIRNDLKGRADITMRRWYYGALILNMSNVEIQLGSEIEAVRALLGLTDVEKNFFDYPSALLGNSRWLSPDTIGEAPPPEILLPLGLARKLVRAELPGIPEATADADLTAAQRDLVANTVIGMHVQVVGRQLEVIGVYDPVMLNEFLDIDGETSTPFDPVQMAELNQQMGVADEEEVRRYIHHSYADVAIAQERMVGLLEGAVRSIAILPHDPADLESIAEDLVLRWDYLLFANIDDKPVLLSSRNATNVAEFWNLLILMVIAALIVFNTMLGSVYERTKEIGTYTALGIAPSHIGRLFLVEAAVFSIIGTMSGYVIGQSIARFVHVIDLPMFSTLNLNYSSLSGVGACVVVMAVVMLSSLYPARKASAIGVPDIERRWKLPKTRDARVTLEMPFTVSHREARGLVAYLREFLDSHAEVATGGFYCENVESGPGLFGDTGSTGLRAQFWLTPLDLGVSQFTCIELYPLEAIEACAVKVHIERLSGDAGSWRRANSGFMTTIRSQFLMWRNLDPNVRAQYVERGKDYASA